MNFKKLTFGFSLALIAATLTRVLQIIFLVEYTNGFYIMDKGLLGSLCLGFIGLVCVVLVFLVFKAEKITITPPKTDKWLAIISVIVAVTLFKEILGENMPMIMPAWQVLLLKMVTMFTAVYFVVICLQGILGFKMPPISHVIPIIYAIVKTIFTFINFSSLALISDNILLLAAYSSLMLLFISYGKLYNNIIEKNGAKKILATAFTTAVITITASVPNIIINIFGKEPYLHTDIDILITLFALGVFIITFIYKAVDKKEHI